MRPWKVKGEGVYPHSADVLTATHLQSIEYYIQKRGHTIRNTIQDRDVLKECRGAKRCRRTPPRLFWVGQDMEEPERREYGDEGGEALTSPLAASHARMAPQAQPLSRWKNGRVRPCSCRMRTWIGGGPTLTLMISRMGVGWMLECRRH